MRFGAAFITVAEENPSSLPRTTAAVEDYLERIRELIQKKGYARVVDIAAELKISQASVTTMVQRLDGEGLVKYEKYRGMVLTGAGGYLWLRRWFRSTAGHPDESPWQLRMRQVFCC